jgi:uncharacterized protein (TIGR03118 family)
MIRRRSRKWRTVQLLGAGLLLVASLAAPTLAGSSFAIDPLVSNNSTNPAQITDSNLVNAWGVSYAPGGAFWVSDEGKGVSTLYTVNPITDKTTKLGLTVTIPGAGTVTGQAYNGTSAFNHDSFLFVSEDGTVSGWRGALGTTAQVLVAGSAANNYQGAALLTTGGNTYLLAANEKTGNIDVINGTSNQPSLTGNFRDPNLPSGFVPYNVTIINGVVYVAYIMPGKPGGIIDAFDTQGNFIKTVSSGGTLDEPWGMVIAPTSYGSIAGDLLVGNRASGQISIIDLTTDSQVGLLSGTNGQPLTIGGLWALIPGNDGSGGSSQQIYFAAGPQGYKNGLFGAIQSVPEPSSIISGLIGLVVVTVSGVYLRKRQSIGGARARI